MRSLRKWPYIFLLPFFFCYFAFNLYPILYSFATSFMKWSALDITNRSFVGLTNYAKVIKDSLYSKALVNTAILMLLSLPLTIISGMLMAVMIDGLRRHKNLIQTIAFMPYITTPMAIGLMFAYLFDWNVGTINVVLKDLGLIEEHINWLGNASYTRYVVALMCIWKNFGYFMVLYMSGLSSISGEYYEAAKVDGANGIQTFFRITVPLLRPITVFAIVNGCIGGFNLFDEPLQLIAGTGSTVVGGPRRSILTMVWYFYNVSFQNSSNYGYGSAIAFTSFAIVAVLSLINVKVLNRKED